MKKQQDQPVRKTTASVRKWTEEIYDLYFRDIA